MKQATIMKIGEQILAKSMVSMTGPFALTRHPTNG